MTPIGTIRTATDSDLPTIRRLLSRDTRYLRSDQHLLTTVTPGAYLIVLEQPAGELVAAALFNIVDNRRRLLMMVVSPDCTEPRAVEARMFGVLETMCTALAAPAVDVATRAA